ncbi:hypothetical protein [Bacillus marinisedimentorum]|nr:hypothetical protein [Bacillus marinisedimentorum]
MWIAAGDCSWTTKRGLLRGDASGVNGSKSANEQLSYLKKHDANPRHAF